MHYRSNLNEFLRQYRTAPHYTTGQSPSQLLWGRQIRTRLHLLRPEEVNSKVSCQQYLASSSGESRQFEDKQAVYFLSGNPRTDKWLKGKISKRLGDLHNEIEFNGKLYKRHVDQVRKEGCDNQSQTLPYGPMITELPDEGMVYRQQGYTIQGPEGQEILSTNGECDTTSESKERESNMYVEFPQTSTKFEGFSGTMRTPLSGKEVHVPSAPKPKIVEQKCELRRSERSRKPRVLFSP